jgi:serine O-acetyltransferase
MKNTMSTFKSIYNKDLNRYNYQPSVYLRLFHFLLRKSSTSKFVLSRQIYRVLYRIWSVRKGLEIPATLNVGPGLYLGHPYNITINPKTIIGANCNIHKGVVIGQCNRGKYEGVPTIGNQVWIGINAAIVGNVTIGDDVLIAPNSFVNVDVPSHSVVFGNPCIIKHRNWATEGYINNI